jgi:hypothetical protein
MMLAVMMQLAQVTLDAPSSTMIWSSDTFLLFTGGAFSLPVCPVSNFHPKVHCLAAVSVLTFLTTFAAAMVIVNIAWQMYGARWGKR